MVDSEVEGILSFKSEGNDGVGEGWLQLVVDSEVGGILSLESKGTSNGHRMGSSGCSRKRVKMDVE